MMEQQDLAHLFDFAQWPIVVARMPAFDRFRMDRWTAGFDVALARGEPFVFVLDMEEFFTDPRESPEEKKKGALWMKRNRPTLTRLCRGNVYIVADPGMREEVLKQTRKQGKALGFRFEAAADLDEALSVARQLLE